MTPSTEPRPVVQALRRIPAELWQFSYHLLSNPQDYEGELIMGALVYWPQELLVNVQYNSLASGHGAAYLVERLIRRVEEFTGTLPDVSLEPKGQSKPWEASGMSRAVWYRRRKAHQMHVEGKSLEEIARVMNVDRSTVERWLA